MDTLCRAPGFDATTPPFAPDLTEPSTKAQQARRATAIQASYRCAEEAQAATFSRNSCRNVRRCAASANRGREVAFAINSSTHIGFTSQEQLDNLELVHLNGRVYDPVIGRFMSADPLIQDPYRSQSHNRYSYVWNNPLNATDPTGFQCTGSRIGSCTAYVYGPSTGPYNGPGSDWHDRRGKAETEAQGNSAQQMTVTLKFEATREVRKINGVEYADVELQDVYAPNIGYLGTYNPHTGEFGSAYEGYTASRELLDFMNERFGDFGLQMRLAALETNRECSLDWWGRIGRDRHSGVVGCPGGIAASNIGRFFYDARPFAQISREYWAANGPAAGRSLHHWLIPQRARWIPAGIRNAGFNLLQLPALRGTFHPSLGLNQWMGFARNWSPAAAREAALVENAIRLEVPAAAGGAGYAGYELGSAVEE